MKINPSVMFEIYFGTLLLVSVISYRDVMLCWAGRTGTHLPLMMKMLWAFKTSGTTHPVTEHNISEDFNIQ
jgi:hypothetical protein